MGSLKIVGNVLITAAVMVVVAGAATASATELYKGGETVEAGTEVVATLEAGSTSSFASTGEDPIFTCTESSLKGTVSNLGGPNSTATIAISHLTFTGGCSFTVDQSKNGTLSIEHITGTINGTLRGSGFYWTVHSPFVGACNYGLSPNTDLGTVTGKTAGTATIDVNAIVTEQEPKRVLCPDTTRWIAQFEFTSPDPFHVTSV